MITKSSLTLHRKAYPQKHLFAFQNIFIAGKQLVDEKKVWIKKSKPELPHVDTA